jgi:hypothetical protein
MEDRTMNMGDYASGVSFEVGYSYDLVLHVKQAEFAGSNIYWDATEERLTFDEAGVDSHSMRQGVFFARGSLVGIAAGAWQSTLGNAGDAGTGTPLYVPDANATSGYKQTNAATMGWAFHTSSGTRIPHFGVGTGYSDEDVPGNVNSYISDPEQNTPEVWATYRGDICQYIGANGGPAGYYMPRPAEFGVGSFPYGGGFFDANGTTEVGWYRVPETTPVAFSSTMSTFDPGGTTEMENGVRTWLGVYFPASGRGGEYNNYFNTEVCYSTSKADYNETYALSHPFAFTGTGMSLGSHGSYNGLLAYSVRCVKK